MPEFQSASSEKLDVARYADALNIMLPAIDGKPDYYTMTTLISAVQKLVIKDVVKYADDKTKAYNTVIENDSSKGTVYTYEIKEKPLMVAEGDGADISGSLVN